MTTRSREVIRETIERITIRYRKGGRTGYCNSCGKPTTWLTAEQALEVFGEAAAPVEGAHLTEAGPVKMLCAESMIVDDNDEEEETNKE